MSTPDEKALAPARGCLWGVAISLGIWALAAFVVIIFLVLT